MVRRKLRKPLRLNGFQICPARLKIRRPSGLGGSTPPPGTKPQPTQKTSVRYDNNRKDRVLLLEALAQPRDPLALPRCDSPHRLIGLVWFVARVHRRHEPKSLVVAGTGGPIVPFIRLVKGFAPSPLTTLLVGSFERWVMEAR
jgi:hypothetical protein